MADSQGHDIESVLSEARKFPPSAEFSGRASIKSLDEYEALCRRAEQDPEKFWGERGNELSWFKPYDKVLEWNPPFAKWFVGGKINASYNCLDRHLTDGRRNKVAFIWEGEPGDSRILTYQMLADEVGRAANALKSPRGEGRRPRRHLHAADSRGRDRDARVRAHRRDSFGRVRRIFRRGARRSHQRRRSAARYHRRCGMASRHPGRPQGQRR